MKKFFAFSLFLIMSYLPLTANSAATIFGGTDCGTWINQNTAANKSWLIGLMSGLNLAHTGQDDPLDKLGSANQIFVWMDNYCKANPLEKVDSGGVSLYLELMKK